MLLLSMPLRARFVSGAAIVAVIVGSAVASVAGAAQAADTPVFTVSTSAGAPGDTVTLSGTGCNPVGPHTGNIYAYQGVKSVPIGPPPAADGLLGGSTMVESDGTWSFSVNVPQTSGIITWVANCGASMTGTPNFWYGQAISYTVSGDTTTTQAPTTTVTDSSTTTTTTVDAGITTTTMAPASVTTAAPMAKPAAVAVAVAATPAYTG